MIDPFCMKCTTPAGAFTEFSSDLYSRAMEPTRIRALIYDFDDTIVESERINDALFSDLLLKEYRLELSQAELDLLYGFSWSGVFDWLAKNRGFSKTMKEVWGTFLMKKRDFLKGRTLRVAQGFDKMLSLPVPQAIVSGSTRAEINVMLDNIGMPARSVDLILSDEDCTRGKPDPEGFLKALELLKASPDEALVFEDSPAGIEAAHRGGIAVAFVAELASRNNARLADLRFPSFEDAYPWVKSRI